MLSLEGIKQGLDYLSVDEVENPKWTLEKMAMIHESLTDDNFMSYILYLSLRTDLTEDDRDTCFKLIKIKQALENRKVEKQYKHFQKIE